MAARSALLNVMIRAADKAGRVLRRDYGEVANLQVSRKGPADFVSAADLRAEKILREELSRARPDYALLMEESGASGDPAAERRWIVDPLDGTSNFLHGLPHFAVSIWLEERVELIAGVSTDAAFGPVILIGMGGIMAEVMEDTALGVAPLDRADAETMVRSLKGFAMLDGARGRPKCDIDAVIDVLLVLSDLAIACPQISELDINPLLTLPAGGGVKAVDALITVARSSGAA